MIAGALARIDRRSVAVVALAALVVAVATALIDPLALHVALAQESVDVAGRRHP